MTFIQFINCYLVQLLECIMGCLQSQKRIVKRTTTHVGKYKYVISDFPSNVRTFDQKVTCITIVYYVTK